MFATEILTATLLFPDINRLKHSKTPLVGEFLTQYLSLTVSLFASLSFFSLVFFPAGSFFAWNLFCTSSAENVALIICTIWWELSISEAQYSLFLQKWSCHAALSCAGGWCTWWPPRLWTWWQSRSSERQDCERWSPPWPQPPSQKNLELLSPWQVHMVKQHQAQAPLLLFLIPGHYQAGKFRFWEINKYRGSIAWSQPHFCYLWNATKAESRGEDWIIFQRKSPQVTIKLF